MLTELFPKAYDKHRSLPLLGGILDAFDDWLIRRGFHSTAVFLLKSGVDLPSISHWLGHASVTTTGRYAKVDLEMKRQALARATTIAGSIAPATWRPSRSVLEWLASL